MPSQIKWTKISKDGAQASLLFSKLPSDFTGQTRLKMMTGWERSGPIFLFGSNLFKGVRIEYEGELWISFHFFLYIMFTSSHSDFTHAWTHMHMARPWPNLAAETSPCVPLVSARLRQVQTYCANMKFWLWLGWVQLEVPDSTFIGLGSGFTKTSITGIHFGEERMKDLPEQNRPAFHTSTPPHTNLNWPSQENQGHSFILVWIYSTWSSSRLRATEPLSVYVTVKRWILEVETLRNKDECVQTENMGLRVSGLESLTLLCPSPAVRSGQDPLHFSQSWSSPLQQEDSGFDDLKSPQLQIPHGFCFWNNAWEVCWNSANQPLLRN